MPDTDPSTWTDFLKNFGALIIAILAFIQPWLLWAWKRFIRKGKVSIHETPRIEVGFREAGPSLGIHGTLRGLNRDLFVKHIALHLTKHKDSSQHDLNWGVFRTRQLSGTGEDLGTMEIPFGFLLSTASPWKFNIQFHDWQSQIEMSQARWPLAQEWSRAMYALYAEVAASQTPPGQTYSEDLKKELADVYNKFRKTQVYSKTYLQLDRICYWEEGEYAVEMAVITSDPDESFVKQWSFHLTAADAEGLRSNVDLVLDFECRQERYVPYYFAEPTLKPNS